MSTTGDPLKRPLVLLIEDEKGLAEEIIAELHRLGYPVQHVDTVAEGLDAARASGAAIMVVDRMLHGSDGLSMVETLREEGVKTPVLVISALSSVDERIRGLKAGGDDYLVKPFAMAELAARIEALLRRLDDVRTTKLRVGELEMDLIEQTVKRGETLIDLLPREFKLLEYFLRRPNQIVTRAMLLEGVWHYRFIPETNVVDVHIGNLRRKIDKAGEPSLITNIRGAGFTLHADA
ncbi:response regulator transcription factor [Methylocapsa sp. S129]|uniref:response regulator transcription factor n=1 Tax=Methylocapsa sp. S129 TaxID=1641869 RepID=UPI00131EC74E|nr:response regulator transcription factor [Methylocapsa sp. S129]